MATLGEIKRIISEHRQELKERYMITEIGIFGSYVRGEQHKKSDVDMLVAFEGPISLLELIGAENYISDLIHEKVDLVPKKDVRPELREVILNEVVYV
jgi:uncharacterized protein